jgi:hydrogenase maturation factor
VTCTASSSDGHCVTCADEGLPLRVVQAGTEAGTALCRGEDGGEALVMTDLVGAAAPGDLLLVHAGVALLRLDGEAATTRGAP